LRSRLKRNKEIVPPEQISALNKAIAEEQKIYDDGGAAVYHSTQPDYYGHSYIRTKQHDFVLDILGMPIAPSKFLLLRDHICGRTDIEAEKKKREEYLARGISYESFEGDFNVLHSKNLLSCSIGLGDISPGDSSLSFWLSKSNIALPLNLKLSIGSKSQLTPHIYSLKEKLQKALHEFDESTKTGVLLQIAFKNKKMIDKIMYPSGPGGYKTPYQRSWWRKLANKSGWAWGKKLARDTDIFLAKASNVFDALMQKPSEFEYEYIDSFQVRVVLTADKMLNASDSEIRHSVEMNAYTDNQDALDKFHTQVDAVFARAKEDYVAHFKTLPLAERLLIKQSLFYKRAVRI